MVGFEILIRIHPEKRREFLQTAELFSKAGERKETRISCHVYEDITSPNRFIWVDQWRDTQTLAEYLKSAQFKTLLGAIEVLGELESRQKVRFEVIQG